MRISKAWQAYLQGLLKTPQEIYRAFHNEREPIPDRFFVIPVDGEKFDAPARLMNAQHLLSNAHLRQMDRANWNGADPRIQEFAGRLLAALRKRNIHFYVFEAVRSKKDQDEYLAKGTSKARWPNAPHCRGGAVDIVHCNYFWDLTTDEWLLVGKLGKDLHDALMRKTPLKDRYEIVWGGDWRKRPTDRLGWDPAHWELRDWKTLPVSPPNAEHIRMTSKALLTGPGPHAPVTEAERAENARYFGLKP